MEIKLIKIKRALRVDWRSYEEKVRLEKTPERVSFLWKKGGNNMEIFICIAVSAITSLVVVIFFAYKYFDVIDKHMQKLLNDTRISIRSAINSLSNTTGNK